MLEKGDGLNIVYFIVNYSFKVMIFKLNILNNNIMILRSSYIIIVYLLLEWCLEK